MYDTLLVTDRGFVFAFLSKTHLERIEKAYRRSQEVLVEISFTDGREVVAKNVLCRYILSEE